MALEYDVGIYIPLLLRGKTDRLQWILKLRQTLREVIDYYEMPGRVLDWPQQREILGLAKVLYAQLGALPAEVDLDDGPSDG